MLGQDFLTLKLFRLSSDEFWSYKQDGLCVLLTQAGNGRATVGAVAQAFSPGDILVVKGHGALRVQAAAGAELVFSCFAARLDHLYPLFAGTEIALLEGIAEKFQRLRHFAANLPLAKQCHRLMESLTPTPNLDHRSQLLRIISIILNEEFKLDHKQRTGVLGIEGNLIHTFEQLSVDELLALSVGELAAKFNCSRRHLNRLFHQYFGFSVSSLRMEMRLLKAISLLRDSNAKVINIAEQCGFNHLGLFNTCFKRRFGVSPGQWRKQTVMPNTASPPALATSHNGNCPLHSKGLCPLTGGNLTAPDHPPASFTITPAQPAKIEPRLAGLGPMPSVHSGLAFGQNGTARTIP